MKTLPPSQTRLQDPQLIERQVRHHSNTQVVTWLAFSGLVSLLLLIQTLGIYEVPRYALLVTVACFLMLLQRRWLSPLMLSPVQLVISIYLALAILGRLLYPRVADAPYGTGIRFSVPDSLLSDAALLLAVSAIAMLLGSALYLVVARPIPLPRVVLRPVIVGPAVRARIAAFSVIPLIMMLIDRSPQGLWRRTNYLDIEGVGLNVLSGVGNQLALAIVLVLGYLVVTESGWLRVFVILLLISYVLVFFSYGSRRLALIPILVAMGALSASLSRRAKVGAVLSVLFSLYLIQLPLFMRGLSQHGLVPYAQALPEFVTNNGIGLASVGLSIFISLPQIGVTAFVEPPIALHDLWIALNPLPGQLAGSVDIGASHRLNNVTPYAGVGELGNFGWVTVLGYFFFVGLLLGYFDRRVRVLLNNNRQIQALALCGLLGLFAIFSIQYQLRTCSRLLIYAIALDLIFRLLSRRKRGLPLASSSVSPS